MRKLCEICSEPVWFSPLVGVGTPTCLEVAEYVWLVPAPKLAVYWIDDQGAAHLTTTQQRMNRVAMAESGIKFYACHTSRPGHDAMRRKK